MDVLKLLNMLPKRVQVAVMRADGRYRWRLGWVPQICPADPRRVPVAERFATLQRTRTQTITKYNNFITCTTATNWFGSPKRRFIHKVEIRIYKAPFRNGLMVRYNFTEYVKKYSETLFSMLETHLCEGTVYVVQNIGIYGDNNPYHWFSRNRPDKFPGDV